MRERGSSSITIPKGSRRSIRARRFVVRAMLASGCSATSEPPRVDLGAHAHAVSDSVSAAPIASSPR
jgi:hypothetical protein